MTGARCLVVEVRFPGGLFHGTRRVDRSVSADCTTEEWPPSPFRLFQALVAGAYGGRWAAEPADDKDAAFSWLEALDAPCIAAPEARALSPVNYFVPNNDLDAVGGDPARVGEIKVMKRLRTSAIGGDRPVVYAWTFDGPTLHAERLLTLAQRLHTLGTGIDQAFAAASVVDAAQLESRFLAEGWGAPLRPSLAAAGAGAGGGAVPGATPCPAPGSLASLRARHAGARQRFRVAVAVVGKQAIVEFHQPARAHAKLVAYGAGPERLQFELRDADKPTAFRPSPQTAAAALVKAVRNLAFDLLADALPERRAALERAIVGRGSPPPEPRTRLRFVPLPSIGLVHTSPSIRRLMVEVPPGSPVSVADLRWALAGRVFGGTADADGVLSSQTLLTPAVDNTMAARYLGTSALWRSVTPVVLPDGCTRDDAVPADGATAPRRGDAAASAVAQALRHADVAARVVSVRLQREPFRQRGRPVADHDADRFGTRRLHHLELRLDRAVSGPLVLGDGRWLGLGVMEPVKEAPPSTHVFRIDGKRPALHCAVDLSRALRSAVMSLVQTTLGARRELPAFFSGHQPDGRPAADAAHQHLFFLADDADGDGRLDRLAVVVPSLPQAAAEAAQRQRRRQLETLAQALRPLVRLRAGPNGCFDLRPEWRDDRDPLFGTARTWESRTPYGPTRQPKGAVEDAIAADLRLECARRGLPAPQSVSVLRTFEGPRGRITAHVRLAFACAVTGPLLLGDGAHFGRSLFQHAPRDPGESH